MRIRWLGWAGVEIEAEGETIVIDPLNDAGAVFRPLGEEAAAGPLPDVVAARSGAVAGLVTHLHRDHADAEALTGALAPGATVHEPVAVGGGDLENLALAQADHELRAAGLERHAVAPWSSFAAGPFQIIALPSLDGIGDPQVAWLVEAEGQRVLHLGDTAFHGHWWRMAQRHGPPDLVLAPVNGAVVRFPHRQPPSPLPVAMDPEQAALAAELLGASLAIPIHFGGYAVRGLYEPVDDPIGRFEAAAAPRTYDTHQLGVGDSLTL